nr:hypothetical protein GCM10025730_04380 [Promicromonospora thailandica]
MARPSSLHDYATHAPSVLGIDVEASILLRQYGADISAASSTPAAARCDRVEALAGDGPCIDAMDELRVRVVTDVAAEQSWHAWRTQAVDEGFATAIAVPGEVGGVQ